MLYLKENNFEKAKEYYEKAIELEPNDATGYHNLGVVFYKFGHLEMAKSYFEKVILINNNFASAYNYLGLIFEE